MDRWLKSGAINKTPATEPSCSIKEGSITDKDGVQSTLLPSTGDFMNYVPKRSKKRKTNNESYLEMGLIETNDGQPQLPTALCIPGNDVVIMKKST